jgi:hypothetical protein
MKKLIALFITLLTLSAQGVEAGVILADKDVTMFRVGGNYQFMEINSKMPVSAVASFAIGSESVVDFTAIELGARADFEINKELYGKGALLLTFLTTSVDLGPFGEGESTDSELTIEIGAGYKVMKNLALEASFGLSGLDGLRLGAVYLF